MRIVGKRKIQPIQFYASNILLKEGCKFNEEIHKLPSGGETCILKGVYRFRSHEQANLHWEQCLAEKMSRRMQDNE